MDVIPHRISVKSLVELVEQQGDIHFSFSGRSTAMEGIRGHQRVQKSRGEGYVAEQDVSVTVEKNGYALTVAGRCDGYYPDARPLIVEEIKTTRSEAAHMPVAVRALHWGQAMVYAVVLARQCAASEVTVRLVYLQLDDDSEYALERHYDLESLCLYFDGLVEKYTAWLANLAIWQQKRDATIADAVFPYEGFRAGQRDMAVSVYRSLKDQGELVLQAPTGIGKTMAAIFPAVKALRELQYDKVFYLTAKGSGQKVAERALADLHDSGLLLHTVTLTAKDKICFNPGSPCHPDYCEFARGYYDRAPGVVRSMLNDVQHAKRSLVREEVEALARANTLCPFELSLDLSRIADVIVCDYNYVFDPTVYLRRYFDEAQGKYALLVDESHNLVDRGRDMFSAALNATAFRLLRKQTSRELPLIAKRLTRVNAAFNALARDHEEKLESDGYVALQELPEKLLSALRRFCEGAETCLQESDRNSQQEQLLEVYFHSLRFIRVSEEFDANYVCMLESDGAIKLLNLNPAPGLAAGLGRGSASICFSATMTPRPYFKRLMGIQDESAWYQVPSPFDPENLGVFVAPFVSTVFRDRERTLNDLVATIGDIVSQHEGNYLVFVPSYVYLSAVTEAFAKCYPALYTLSQYPGMDTAATADFLARFENEPGPGETLVGFAVMGGVFGEGIDLKGSRLIGVIIAGVGIPKVCPQQELIREYFSGDGSGEGFTFAYRYPGINRVLQTAGRVIRSETDRGIVCLIDQRYTETAWKKLLPATWRVKESRTREALATEVMAFWRR